ncbi:MAG: RHS repeat-associated core domain-containing protein [Myroides sp.]|nr:RHS repeat-associated core domain-containing protein [Myroides sp.]
MNNNGAEYEGNFRLNGYEMDLRQYDPAIARWVVQDPVIHHEYSPYSAFDNNPVFWSDPSGADSVTDWMGRDKFDPNGIYIIPPDRVGGDIELASFYTWDARGKQNSGSGSPGNGPDKKSGGGVSKLWNRFKSWLRGEPKYTSVTVLVGPMEGDGYEEGIPCVECHHTTLIPNGKPLELQVEVKEGVALWGMASEENLITAHKNASVLFSLDMSDVFMRSSAGGSGAKWLYEFLSGMSAREDDFKRGADLFKSKKEDPYVHHTYKKFKILPSPYINNKNYIIPDRQDTIIRQSQIQKVDKASIYDSLRLLPLLNKPN